MRLLPGLVYRWPATGAQRRLRLLLLLLVGFLDFPTMAVSQENGIGSNHNGLLWSSAGGGWRSMFADVGYATLFRQAGLFDANGTRFDAISTTSGASWFSTQLFYSDVFYKSSVLSETPQELESFVLTWMNAYAGIAKNISHETRNLCRRLATEHWIFDKITRVSRVVMEYCEVAAEHENDWALFVQELLRAASEAIGDPDFVERVASSQNRIDPMRRTDLLIQSALLPNSRFRNDDANATSASTAVYLGYDETTGNDENTTDPSDPELLTVALSAAWVVEDSNAGFWYGTDDLTTHLQTYIGKAPDEFSLDDWEAFYLYPNTQNGTLTIDSDQAPFPPTEQDVFRTPFGGSNATNVAQLAAVSSATGGYLPSVVPSAYAQQLSYMLYDAMEDRMPVWGKVLCGIVAGLVASALLRRCCCRRAGAREGYEAIPTPPPPRKRDPPGAYADACCCCDSDCCRYSCCCQSSCCNRECARSIASGCCCLVVAVLVGTYVSFGSALIPVAFHRGFAFAYENPQLDGLSICSQWPSPCGKGDAHFSDGLYTDNPAVVINVGHYLRKHGVNRNQTLRLILTNTNQMEDWDSDVSQFLQYFQTDFNEGVEPGGFLWNPGLYVPYRSPQIFEEFLDVDGLNNALRPVPNSNMTTAILQGTTIDNPSFGVVAGQSVEILLLNLNAVGLPTILVGRTEIDRMTQPLADMTNHVAFNQDLLERVTNFVRGGN